MSVLVLGSVNMDLVIHGARLPAAGETVLGGEFLQSLGGKGANQAVAAARAGQDPVSLVAAVGDDDFGRHALQQFAKENLDTRHVMIVSGATTGIALIMVDAAGENLISVASGANAVLSPADIDALPDEHFRASRVFLACLESPVETVKHCLARAKDHGLLTILNPAPANRDILDGGRLNNVDVITPNRIEAETLVNVEATTEEQVIAAAEGLRAMGAGAAVITLGSEGCLVAEKAVTAIQSHDVDPVDSTAAGDAFNGAMAVALAEGKSLTKAAQWANRAAALAVTKPGAIPSLPTRDQIDSP